MVKIEGSYGEFSIEEPDGNIVKAKTVEDIEEILLPKSAQYNNSTVKATTYVYSDETLWDMSDLAGLVALCCWGKKYKNDSIKVTITAEYCPEDK